MTYPLANVSASASNGSIVPYLNGTLSATSQSSSRSFRPVTDFVAERIYVERKREFFTALNKILPVASPTARISPLVQFLMMPPKRFGSDEKIKQMLNKPGGYLRRFFGNESWTDWLEDRTDLGYAVGNMLGILETGPGRSVEKFVATLDPQRLAKANAAAEIFLQKLGPVVVSPKSQPLASESAALVRGRRDIPALNFYKLGSEFPINTFTTENNPGDASISQICRLTDRQFVVIWFNHDKRSIFAQLFNSDVGTASLQKIGDVYPISTTSVRGYRPAAVGLTDSRFMVTWACDTGSSSCGVFGQFFEISGTSITASGAAFQITTVTQNASDGGGSSVILLPGSSKVVVTWRLDGQTAKGFGIAGQVYDFTGSKVGEEFQVTTSRVSGRPKDNIAALANDQFIVVWSDLYEGVYAQLFNSSGSTPSPVGTQFLVREGYTFEQPSITRLSDRRVVVTVQLDSYCYGQLVDCVGGVTLTKVGLAFRINTLPSGYSTFDITSVADNQFIAVWGSRIGASAEPDSIKGQFFDATENSSPRMVDGEFRIDPDLPPSDDSVTGVFYPCVERLDPTRSLVTWFRNFPYTVPYDGFYGQLLKRNEPPIVTAISNQSISAGQTVTISLPSVFTDPDSEALTYGVTVNGSAALPSWIRLNVGVLTLQPPLSAVGQYTIGVSASDGITETVSTTFTLDVAQNQAVTAVTPLPKQTVPYTSHSSVDVGAFFADPDGDAITISVTLSDGSLPSWLIYDNSSKQLRIEPNSDRNLVGDYTIRFQATDAFHSPTETTMALSITNPSAESSSSSSTPIVAGSSGSVGGGVLLGLGAAGALLYRRNKALQRKMDAQSAQISRTQYDSAQALLVDALEFIRSCIVQPKGLKRTVFISYAWPATAAACSQLQTFLTTMKLHLERSGMTVLLDIDNLRIGNNIDQYMLDNIKRSDYCLVIGTPRYKERAEALNDAGQPLTNAGKEWVAIQDKRQRKPNSMIPVWREGNFNTTFPAGVGEVLAKDFSTEEAYYKDVLGMVGELFSISDHSRFKTLEALYRVKLQATMQRTGVDQTREESAVLETHALVDRAKDYSQVRTEVNLESENGAENWT